MKLSELFPNRPTISFGEKEYSMEYTAFSEMLLENDYGSYEEFAGKAMELSRALTTMQLNSVKLTDIINFLFAGLIHTDLLAKFVDKSRYPWNVKADEAKAFLATVVYRRDLPAYISIITQSFGNSMVSKEMHEMLDVLAAQSQKKTQETIAPADGLETTPISPSSADEVKSGSGTQPDVSE